MKKSCIILIMLFALILTLKSQDGNLLINGDFKSLRGWTSNDNLRRSGKVELLSQGNGVMITNPVIDLDGSIYQEIATGGHEWFSWSMKIKAASIYDGGAMMRASAAFVSLDRKGNVLDISTPTNISGTEWRTYSGTVRVPPGTQKLRVLLSVLDGSCTYADVTVNKGTEPQPVVPRSKIVSGNGFSVSSFTTDRPLWDIFCDDIDNDGAPEIIACDVDGIVTMRKKGMPPFLTFSAGALVFQFASADLNGDGTKEILVSSVDPKFPVKAIDMSGQEVIKIQKIQLGFDRIAAEDMDGDGVPEIAVSKRYGLQSSGLAGGIILYDNKGRILWEVTEVLREFHFADILPDPGIELVVGGPGVDFRIYNKSGKLAEKYSLESTRIDHFTIADNDQDGKNEIITSANTGGRMTLWCTRGENIVWKNVTPSLSSGGNLAGMNLASGDFDKSSPGTETVLVGIHDIFLVDAAGNLISANSSAETRTSGRNFLPKGINSSDIAVWNEKDPELYLSSSRYRHSAYYSLKYVKEDQFSSFLVPDQEEHFENIYNELKKRPPVVAGNGQKVKVFIALGESATVPEDTLKVWRSMFDKLETSNLEYMVMYEASDLLGHERGQKMTADQIAERAGMFEKTGIPFGYFCTHGGQVWLSWEAIKKTKEVAPTMFRFLYIAENLETLYSPLYKDMLKWTQKALDYCAGNNLKMIFKEKHDSWGLLPSDPEIFSVLFNKKYRDVTVPIWSTNQPYQPEIQLGGMLGLKASGLCSEFGMSSQFWNYHSWGNYPHGVRDVPASSVCPSDIMGRLDLIGIALGGTWVHIEGGQPYLSNVVSKGVSDEAKRHRDLVFELVRKNLITPGSLPVNINQATIVRSFHNAMEAGKQEGNHVAHPYFNRNTEELRNGFIPARTCFETYSEDAFPLIGYSSKWNSVTSFPETPNGWIPVIPAGTDLLPGMMPVLTDGEKVMSGKEWKKSEDATREVKEIIASGKVNIPFEATGTCMVIRKDDKAEGTHILIITDPGYLAPKGVETVIKPVNRKILKATDMVTGEILKSADYSCPVKILPGAFRVIKVESKLN